MENNELIIREDNVRLVITTIPKAYAENKASYDRCKEAGEQLLAQIEREGMSMELDSKAAEFIRKANATVKAMNTRRSASTKFMDDIRSVFTGLESDISPANNKSIAYRLQEHRNNYAAQQYALAEEERRKAAEKEAKRIAENKYKSDLAEEYNGQFSAKLGDDIEAVISTYKGVTLETYEEVFKKISVWDCNIPAAWFLELCSTIQVPRSIPGDQQQAIRGEVLGSLIRRYQDQYRFEMESTRDQMLLLLPSKKKELESQPDNGGADAAHADEDIIAKIRDTATTNAKQVQAGNDATMGFEAQDLFACAEANAAVNLPKVKQRKVAALRNGKGILNVIALWWEHEGHNLSVLELEKMFKKQMEFCTKLANQPNPAFIDTPDVVYKTQITAK